MTLTRALRRACALCAVLFLAAGSVQADLIFTAPPRESSDRGEDIYGPLAAHLSELLGTKVVYQHPEGWPQYTRAMRAGEYDLVFDGPHFVAWRMEHVQHQPLVRLPGYLVFHLVTNADDQEIRSAEDLAGRRVCGIAPPNLGTMTVIRAFPNPSRQPVIVPMKGGFKGVHQGLKEGRCRAAVLRTQFFDKGLSDEQRALLNIVSTSAKYPNQAISAGPRVTDEQKRKLVESLTGAGAAAAQPIFDRFARNASAFQAVEENEFNGHNLLLEGVIWGW